MQGDARTFRQSSINRLPASLGASQMVVLSKASSFSQSVITGYPHDAGSQGNCEQGCCGSRQPAVPTTAGIAVPHPSMFLVGAEVAVTTDNKGRHRRFVCLNRWIGGHPTAGSRLSSRVKPAIIDQVAISGLRHPVQGFCGWRARKAAMVGTPVTKQLEGAGVPQHKRTSAGGQRPGGRLAHAMMLAPAGPGLVGAGWLFVQRDRRGHSIPILSSVIIFLSAAHCWIEPLSFTGRLARKCSSATFFLASVQSMTGWPSIR